MTMFFYLLMLLSGFVIAFMACRHHYRLRQQQRIIAGVEKDRQHTRQSTIDVDNILIDNSSWLSLLKQLDTHLSWKAGVLAAVVCRDFPRRAKRPVYAKNPGFCDSDPAVISDDHCATWAATKACHHTALQANDGSSTLFR
ncbi:hypothetical protein [Duffyella gerundensis]|uniref:hypothetical protein n=1 Tax=Duffyella gerundensis TaxID=1619313 RepID=UPI0021F7A212|nr:hypothetical protein [Duffyella gerundensis]